VLHVNGCSNCKNVRSKEDRRLLCRHPEALHEEEEEEEEQVGFFETFLNLTVESRHFMVK
jgi:hypothetical protein